MPDLTGWYLTGVSLFAGIGGFDLALRDAGVDVKAAVEIDPACRAKLAEHFPETTLFPDVTKVTARDLLAAGFVPDRGIITGGWPCQDLSIAGRRAGLGGARSGLFWHVVRLARELRPRYLILENVPGLLHAVCSCPGDGSCAANGRAVRCGAWRPVSRTGTAASTCLSCGCEWTHHAPGTGCTGPCGGTCDDELAGRRARKVFVPAVPHGVAGGACPGGCMGLHGGAMGTVVGALEQLGYGLCWRVLDAQFFGVPQRRKRIFFVGCAGNGAAPVEVLLEPESGGGNPPPRGAAGTDIAATLGSRIGGARTTDLDGHGAYITGTLASDGQRRGWVDEDQPVGGTVATLQGGGRRGHRVDAEGAAGGHLIAFDAAQITHPENRVRPRPGQPAPPLAATGQPMLAVRAPAPAGDATGFASAGDFSVGGPVASPVRAAHGQPGCVGIATAVRRLTPLECERLQGFPDNWTAGQSDAARYRQCGNAVAVVVARWLTRRTVAVDQQMWARQGVAVVA